MIDSDRQVLDYEIIEETTYMNFNSTMGLKLSEGFQPCGELHIDVDSYNVRYYIQPVVKYEE